MAQQFNGRITHEALRAQVAGEVAATVPAATDSPAQPGTDVELVTDWLTRLHLLQGVPFNYLVPDIGMLPTESIRFFQVDNNWLAALLDGAYSVGFAAAGQAAAAQALPVFLSQAAHRARSGATRRALLHQVRSRTGLAFASTLASPAAQELAAAPEVLSGFLLRSAVVAGWPGMEVFGYADAAGSTPLQIVRFETVAPSLLLCLFGGLVARVDFREPSEAVHFGLDANGTNWQKDLRYANGNSTTAVGSFTGASVSVPLRGSAGEPAIVPLATLAGAMANQVWTTPPPADTSFTAAQFALEMVEGVQVVEFKLSTTS
jgi:hypothetical protein